MSKLSILVCVVLCPCLAGCGTRPAVTAITVNPSGTRLVCAVDGPAHGLYAFDIGRRKLDPLFVGNEYVDYPCYSPDGASVVFSAGSQEGGPHGISLIPAAGGLERRLTAEDSVYDVNPSFSPDGKVVVFARAVHRWTTGTGGNMWDDYDLYTVPVAGGPVRRLTYKNFYQAYDPWFLASSKEIVFTRVFASGSNPTLRVCKLRLDDRKASLSVLLGDHIGDLDYVRSKESLLFTSNRTAEYVWEIWQMRPDGTQEKQITKLGWNIEDPVGCEETGDIFFLAQPSQTTGNEYSVYRINWNGRGLSKLIDASVFGNLSGAAGR